MDDFTLVKNDNYYDYWEIDWYILQTKPKRHHIALDEG